MIDKLIDKQDSFEIVRDKIAQILADETASQQALATTEGEDPTKWAFKVFTERMYPWEDWQGSPGNEPIDPTPRVNVWYETSSFPKGSGNTTRRQKSQTTFNIDIAAIGESAPGVAGDEDATYNAQRILRLVRNILMADIYTYLDLRGLVWSRWPSSMNVFKPEGLDTAQRVHAARFQLEVDFNELSPQQSGVDLESIAFTIKRAEDGSVLAQAQYDY